MKRKFFTTLMREESGATAAITALCILPLVAMLSLAIDMGHLYSVRNELQNVADAAALGAVGQLVQNQNGTAVRDSQAAVDAAMNIAQRQATLNGLPSMDTSARNDVTVKFGLWNTHASSPAAAWTEIGTSCPSNSDANAVQVGIKRAEGTAYGPVVNFIASIFGKSSTEVEAQATAYLGFAKGVTVGTVDIPVAVPDTLLTAAANQEGKSHWLAKLLGPREATAVNYASTTFKDLGSDTFYQNNQNKPQLDTSKAYMVVVNSSDSVPSTVINNLKKNYTTGTAVRAMAVGTRLYPLSEYQWASNIKSIFAAFKSAYDAKKDGQGKWRVTVPVYDTTNPLAQKLKNGLINLANLLSPGAKEAQACFTFWSQTYPGGNVPLYVTGFTEVNVVNVTYNSNCDDCSPYAPATNGVTYNNTVDCMVRNTISCRNANSVTIEVPKDASTKISGGATTGGPDNNTITPGGLQNIGAFAGIPKLVK